MPDRELRTNEAFQLRGGEKMTVKAVICVKTAGAEEYDVFFRYDGGPLELGADLLDAVRETGSVEQAVKKVGAGPLDKCVQDPWAVYPSLKNDIEWIYVLTKQGTHGGITLEINKTSYPCTTRRFIWQVWAGKTEHVDKVTAARQMEIVEMTANCTLGALHAFEQAK